MYRLWLAPEIKDSASKHAPTRKSLACFGTINLSNAAFELTLENRMSDQFYFGMPPEGLYPWGTLRDEDDGIDFGDFTLGNDMFGFAILGNEKGEERYTHDVTGEVYFGESGYWQDDIEYSAFGQEWQFMPDPNGRLVGLGSLEIPQVDGRRQRQNNTGVAMARELTGFIWDVARHDPLAA